MSVFMQTLEKLCSDSSGLKYVMISLAFFVICLDTDGNSLI